MEANLPDLSPESSTPAAETWPGLLDELGAALEQQRQLLKTHRALAWIPGNTALIRLYARLRQVVVALDEERQLRQEEVNQLRRLQEISSVINSSLDIAEVLNLVMDSIVSLLNAERALLMLRDDETGRLEVQVARNINRETIEQATFDISRSIVNAVFDTGVSVVTTNASSDPRFSLQESIINFSLRSILCVPLRIKEVTFGVIYADSRAITNVFVEADRNLLAAFANQAASVIENARLFRQISDQLADITAMKFLMDDVFASIASGVITIDMADRISLFNHAAERMLGISPHQVLNHPYHEALASIGHVVAVMVDQVKRHGGTRYAEIEKASSHGGGKTSLVLNCSPLRDARQETLGVVIVLDDVTEKKRLEGVRRYLPPGLVDRVHDLTAAQRPQRQTLSIMFADVRGFSAFGEWLPPEQLVEIINGYFTVAARALHAYEGVIDKFLGDAVMVLFNTPLNPQANHAERAVRAALAMQEALTAYHARIPEAHRLHFGIGIHTGEAVVGNVGGDFRQDYTAIGDAVNLAKRLQELAQPGQVLISSQVYALVRAWAAVEALPPVQVKGRRSVEQIYALRRGALS